jgi:hypothetical protein
MKHATRFLLCGFFAAIPLILFSGCYTQVGTARGDVDEGYDYRTPANDQTAANDQSAGDTTQPGDYDSARREFYNDSYYPPDYPAYSIGIGFGWHTPWYGYGYPWYFYDGYPYYGGFYPYAFSYPHHYSGYYNHGGGYAYYGRGYATRRYGMARTTGGSRGVYATPAGGHPGSPLPAGRTGATRGILSTGRSSARGAIVARPPSSRGYAGTRVSPRSQSGMRGPSSRSAPQGSSQGRSGGRGYSSPSGHPAPSGGGSSRGGSSGGGGGSRGGGGSSGGGGGSRGGGGRR